MPPKGEKRLAQEVLRTHTTAYWIVVLKQRRTFTTFCFGGVGPFSFPNAPFRGQT